MLTSEGSLNRSTHIIEDKSNGKKRKLTPIECERLNGFPDNWTNTEMPERQRYFIMGNATILVVFDFFGCNDILASGNMAKVGFGDNDVDRGFRIILRIRCKVIYPR